MGAWGTSLYANDSACDIRGDYLDMLRRGKTNEEVTRELIRRNESIMGDEEEEPLFWFALADTQWNYGRLLPEVKERALFFLSQDADLERWRESGEKKLQAWIKTLEQLEGKLRSPQPPEKKVSRYRLYQCKWKLGDVFAYQFVGEYSKETGFYGQYVIFRKVSEAIWWPGHIVPVVQVYKWIGNEIPPLSDLPNMRLLELKYFSTVLSYDPNHRDEYVALLLSTSQGVIPKDNLYFLGNLQGEDINPPKTYNCYSGYPNISWKGPAWKSTFEKYIIDQYLSWKDIS